MGPKHPHCSPSVWSTATPCASPLINWLKDIPPHVRVCVCVSWLGAVGHWWIAFTNPTISGQSHSVRDKETHGARGSTRAHTKSHMESTGTHCPSASLLPHQETPPPHTMTLLYIYTHTSFCSQGETKDFQTDTCCKPLGFPCARTVCVSDACS